MESWLGDSLVSRNSTRWLRRIASASAVGDADSPLARVAKLPYLATSAAFKAVDDPASVHYNRIVDLSSVAQPDWTSCEEMLRADGRYAIGAVVAHNADPPLPGAGSCIFLHVWECAGAPTAGCTAMPRTAMSDLAGWLDGAATPLLVQLPQAEYESKRAEGGLPLFVPKPVGTPCGEPDMPLR